MDIADYCGPFERMEIVYSVKKATGYTKVCQMRKRQVSLKKRKDIGEEFLI